VTSDAEKALTTGRLHRLITHLPPATASAGKARTFVSRGLRAWGLSESLSYDIVLSTSELVTNAVEHGRGEVAVELRLVGRRVVLRVWDDLRETPVLTRPGVSSPRGRGLAIVEALAASWGCQHAEDGKWVWAEFSLPRR
jgi:anti-sigma regulatory factor (Ser/Thr protein kinase)